MLPHLHAHVDGRTTALCPFAASLYLANTAVDNNENDETRDIVT